VHGTVMLLQHQSVVERYFWLQLLSNKSMRGSFRNHTVLQHLKTKNKVYPEYLLLLFLCFWVWSAHFG